MRMRILGHRIVVLLGMMLMVLGCVTPPGPLMEGEETSPRPSPRGEGGACRTLVGIDNLMWQQPDSAFALLIDFAASPEADSLDVFDIHYFQLLVAELLYKNDYEQSNRAEILQTVAYFDSLVAIEGADTRGVSVRPVQRRDASHASAKTKAFLAARAHYINGVGFYERDSVVEACAEYLKTLEIMEGNFEEKELVGHKARFMSYTYNRLGDLFENQILAEPAIICYKQALYHCKTEPTSKYGIPVLLYNIGILFDVAGSKDSADYYYEEALANMPDNDNIHYRDIMATKAVLYYNMGRCADSAINNLKYVISLASDDNERLTRFLTLGNILFEDQQYDSSRRYLEAVFEQQYDVLSKVTAAQNLCSLYQMEGDSVTAQKYATFLSGFTMTEIEKKKDLSKVNEMLQDYLSQKRQKRLHQHLKEQYTKQAVIVTGSLIAFISAGVFLYFWYKRKGEHLKAQIKEEKHFHKQQQKALSGRLKQKNQEVRELKDQLSQKDETAKIAETAASFAEEPICRLIMERVNEGCFKSKMDCEVYKRYALDKMNLLDLRLAADRHYGQFTVRLKKAYPELTNTDLDYCCLYLLGLTDADVAALMQRAYNTVTERDGKLRKIIGNSNPLSKTLSEIANGSLSVDL